MGLITTKDIYMKMCYQSNDFYEMTDDERRALQKHLVKMYADIEKVCNRHNLKVMLAYGSVLGAIRHGDVIPWDDDLDLYMPREDYEKFLHEYSKELPENYIIYAPNHPNGSISNFGKVVDKNTTFVPIGSENSKHYRGVYVDVFPLDHIGTNLLANKYRQMKLLFLKYVIGSVRQYKGNSKIYKELMSGSFVAKFNYRFRRFIGFVMSFRSISQWVNTIDNVFASCHQDTGFIHDSSGWRYDMNPLPQEMFFPPRKVKFGDIEAFVPNHAEEYLERCYGNWRQIPPPEKRWRHFIMKIDLSKGQDAAQ